MDFYGIVFHEMSSKRRNPSFLKEILGSKPVVNMLTTGFCKKKKYLTKFWFWKIIIYGFREWLLLKNGSLKKNPSSNLFDDQGLQPIFSYLFLSIQ